MSDIDSVLKLIAIISSLCLAGCDIDDPKAVKNQQSEKAAQAANSIQFTDNAEIDNIKRRIEITAHPGKLGFIMLMNEAGQPILYEGVKGKVTSGGKRLTTPDRIPSCYDGRCPVRAAPSDEGTWGSSAEYIFYWTVNDEYRQWNGKYLYADKPFRLRIEPLIISTPTTSAAK